MLLADATHGACPHFGCFGVVLLIFMQRSQIVPTRQHERVILGAAMATRHLKAALASSFSQIRGIPGLRCYLF
jgi:hypothetical protein